jgi:hypothetical protein
MEITTIFYKNYVVRYSKHRVRIYSGNVGSEVIHNYKTKNTIKKVLILSNDERNPIFMVLHKHKKRITNLFAGGEMDTTNVDRVIEILEISLRSHPFDNNYKDFYNELLLLH